MEPRNVAGLRVALEVIGHVTNTERGTRDSEHSVHLVLQDRSAEIDDAVFAGHANRMGV